MACRHMQRREFITLLGSAAAAWSFAAWAQQGGGIRRIGVLTPWPADDAEAQSRVTAFVQALQQLGWSNGQNVRIDYRLGDGKANTMRKYAAELVALAPDVILALSSGALAPLLEVSRTVPVVFAGVADPLRPATSRACRGQGATPPVLLSTNIPSAGNGWSCKPRQM